MKFGGLFTGIGGLDLGLERAGMTCLWQVERDAYCRGVLAKHWPNVRRYGDVRECGAHNLQPVDLICGGFPCQSVSQAGQRKGEDDPRWLWPEFYRIVRELRPRWVLAENVPGLLSTDSGRLFGGILRDLAESGYDAEWDCIPAAAVGAPHLRYRVFVVAYTKKLLGNECENNTKFSVEEEPLSKSGDCGRAQVVADTHEPRLERYRIFGERGGEEPAWKSSQEEMSQFGEFWQSEPSVGRVADGVPQRVDRLRSLGNAVVPQVAEWLGKRILGAEGGG